MRETLCSCIWYQWNTQLLDAASVNMSVQVQSGFSVRLRLFPMEIYWLERRQTNLTEQQQNRQNSTDNISSPPAYLNVLVQDHNSSTP